MPEKKGNDKYEEIIKITKKLQKEKKGVSIEEEEIKVVIFSLSGSLYAFYASFIKSILPYNAVTFVPGCPDYILGIINVRGDIESVINMHHFLGKKNEPLDSRTRIVIAEAAGIRSGILLNSVEEVIDLPLSSISPAISTIENSIKDFVAGELAYKNILVTIIDLEKIFTRINV